MALHLLHLALLVTMSLIPPSSNLRSLLQHFPSTLNTSRFNNHHRLTTPIPEFLHQQPATSISNHHSSWTVQSKSPTRSFVRTYTLHCFTSSHIPKKFIPHFSVPSIIKLLPTASRHLQRLAGLIRPLLPTSVIRVQYSPPRP